MGKTVLILSSSPRRGDNSDLLCDQFLLGAKEAGNQAEKIFLRDKKINYCTGCYACKGRGTCAQRDDMAEVLEKMIVAEVIVMATPVYFYTMDAQMKTLIDRTCARYTEIRNKEFYFRGFTSCLSGAREQGIVYGVGAWNMGDIKGTKAMTEAFAMGKAI